MIIDPHGCPGHPNPFDSIARTVYCTEGCRMYALTDETRHHVAKFHRAGWADAFAARLATEPTVSGILRRPGNLVEFDARLREGESERAEWTTWAELVGYHSSPNDRGTLDGRPAIACY